MYARSRLLPTNKNCVCKFFLFRFFFALSWSEYWTYHIHNHLQRRKGIMRMIYGHSLNCNFYAVCLFVVVVRSALHTLTLEYSVNVCRQRCMNLIRYARDDRISVKKRRVFPPWIDYKKRKIRFMLLIKLKKKIRWYWN